MAQAQTYQQRSALFSLAASGGFLTMLLREGRSLTVFSSYNLLWSPDPAKNTRSASWTVALLLFSYSLRDEAMKSTLELFMQNLSCTGTAVLWLGHAYLACEEPAFRTPFWICVHRWKTPTAWHLASISVLTKKLCSKPKKFTQGELSGDQLFPTKQHWFQ